MLFTVVYINEILFLHFYLFFFSLLFFHFNSHQVAKFELVTFKFEFILIFSIINFNQKYDLTEKIHFSNLYWQNRFIYELARMLANKCFKCHFHSFQTGGQKKIVYDFLFTFPLFMNPGFAWSYKLLMRILTTTWPYMGHSIR